MNNLAPIAIFAYNRPSHLKKCLVALKRNVLSANSCVYVFIDKVKDEDDIENMDKNLKVIEVAKMENWCKECTIIIREKNYGIEKNIIEGVSDLVNKYGKVIVIEDDLVVSNSFLEYMNNGLEYYQNIDVVKQVVGFNLLESVQSNHDAILLPIASSWGWGTWDRVWSQVDFLDKSSLSKIESYLFDLEGAFPYYKLLKNQISKNNTNTWDVQFWKYVLKSKGLVLYPKKNLVLNSGFDGSGVHYIKEVFQKQQVFSNDSYQYFPSQIKFEINHFNSLKNKLLSFQVSSRLAFLNYLCYYLKKIWYYKYSFVKYYKN